MAVVNKGGCVDCDELLALSQWLAMVLASLVGVFAVQTRHSAPVWYFSQSERTILSGYCSVEPIWPL
jgi:hypothetical protein